MDPHIRKFGSAGFLRKALLPVLLPMLVLFVIVPPVADAQVTTNITSSGLNTQVNQVSNSYNITGGTRPGGGPNLFHSFGNFSIGAGDIGNFQNTLVNGSFPATSNILGRVTGGNISNIYGTIQTTNFGNANLFLMNPSGIVLGPNASLNVGGSVSFTTAQYIRLLDQNFSGANFYANPANDALANSILSIDPGAFEFLSANPNAYGFLTAPDPNVTITVHSSALAVPSGQSISLVGGKVVIEGGAQLSAPNGTIQIATASSPGEFASSPFETLANATALFAGPNSPVDPALATSFTSYGIVSVAPGSSIDVHGTSTVLIKGGQLVISVNDATLNTSVNSLQSNTISFGPGSAITTANSGTDLGVDVQLTAPNVSLNGTTINSQTDGVEHGGNITLTAEQVTLGQGARIVTGSGGEGGGGDVIIQGPQEAGGVATSVTLSGSSVIGGSIFGSGAGGKIAITAESLDLSGFSSIISSTNGSASNGDIVVSVHNARLADGSTFASDTAFAGEGVVGGNITVQGLDGGGSKAASLILEGSRSGLSATTSGTGKLGNIEVHAETLSMTGGAVIEAGSPLDTASAGSITIEANSVSLSGRSTISSHTFNLDAGPVNITANQFNLDNSTIATNTSSSTSGRGGNVVLNVGSASLTNGATINSSADNTGVAGNISILASGSVTMTSGSTITASTAGTGGGGNILINGQSVQLSNGSLISASSTAPFSFPGEGNAGNITVNSGSNFIMQNSSMTTEATHTSGGAIEINAPNMVQLINSKVTTEVKGTQGDTAGGNITIDPQYVILQNSQVIAKANAGTGGNITITSGVFLADPNSEVNASSALGVSGTVDIRSPVSNISGIIGRLPESVLAAKALLRAACAARLAESQVSSFVERGRDHIPVGPEGLLATPYVPPLSEPSALSAPSLSSSGVQMRRLTAPDFTRPVHILSGDAACQS